MKTKPLRFTLCMLIAAALAPMEAKAVTSYNENITSIFGAGNPDGGWTVDTVGNIQLGLRAKDRTTGATTNNGAGTYYFPAGTDPSSPTRAVWNYEFSINSNFGGGGSSTLASFLFLLYVDTDPSAGVNYVAFNPLLAFSDNAYGDNSTPNGGGVTGPFAISGLGKTLGQNSENLTFFPFSIDPFQDGDYSFMLQAYDFTGNTLLASTSMNVHVGTVPDGGQTALLFGTAIGALALFGKSINRSQKLTAV